MRPLGTTERHEQDEQPRRRVRIAVALLGVAVAAALVAVLPVQQPALAPEPLAVDHPESVNGAPAGDEVRTVELSFTTRDGQTRGATLHLPRDGQRVLPGMVLVHGSGPGPREKYEAEGMAFAAAGIATLTYDKRTDGYSLATRSYQVLAEDAIAAADLLRTQPQVDPDLVGVWGFSEGGWVAPLAAGIDPRTAFLVTVGANGVPPLRQQAWADASRWEHLGLEGSLVDAASRTMYRWIDGLGMFPEAHHDPVPALRDLRLPVLGIWGAKDRATPPVESVEVHREQLELAGNRHHTLRTIADADHAIRHTSTGYGESTAFAPGYVDLVGRWVGAVAAGRAPGSSVAGVGVQSRPTAAVPPLSWYESIAAQATVVGLMVAGFAGVGLVRGWRRLRGKPGHAAVAERVLVVSGPLSMIGGFGYLMHLQLTAWSGGSLIGPLVAGRPIPWLVVQALAVVTTVATAALAVRCGRRGPDGVGTWLLLTAGAAFIPWAVLWGLLLP